jgi:hypothetical protein
LEFIIGLSVSIECTEASASYSHSELKDVLDRFSRLGIDIFDDAFENVKRIIPWLLPTLREASYDKISPQDPHP